MQALFGKNVCENERIGFCRGRALENFVCRSANDCTCSYQLKLHQDCVHHTIVYLFNTI